MARLQCPHCQRKFSVSHSAFVTGREELDGEEIPPGAYHPDQRKDYKTTEASRRRALAYYWKHREAVLERETRRRKRTKTVHVKMRKESGA